jgi:mRNA-degrading endonuclease YafQ of YafQ-DinJ toxin-antitoxin module
MSTTKDKDIVSVDLEQKQKELVAKLSYVHEKLRRDKKKVFDKDEKDKTSSSSWDDVWKAHTQDVETLKVF